MFRCIGVVAQDPRSVPVWTGVYGLGRGMQVAAEKGVRVSLAGGVWRLRRIECTGELGVVVADRPRGDIIAIRSVRGGGECSSVECTAGQR